MIIESLIAMLFLLCLFFVLPFFIFKSQYTYVRIRQIIWASIVRCTGELMKGEWSYLKLKQAHVILYSEY